MAKVEYKPCEKCNNSFQNHVNGKCTGCIVNERLDFGSMTVFEKLESIKKKMEDHSIDLKNLDNSEEIILTINGITISYYPKCDELAFLIDQLLMELNSVVDGTIRKRKYSEPTYGAKI